MLINKNRYIFFVRIALFIKNDTDNYPTKLAGTDVCGEKFGLHIF